MMRMCCYRPVACLVHIERSELNVFKVMFHPVPKQMGGGLSEGVTILRYLKTDLKRLRYRKKDTS